MAFDAAASGSRRGPSTAASGDDVASAVSLLSQRVWTLVQTKSQIESLSAALGSAADTGALRQKVLAVEGTAQSLQNEIDVGLRKLRVVCMSSSDHTAQRQLKRLEEQYTEVRGGVAASVAASRLKRRQFEPTESSAAELDAARAKANGGAAAGARRGAGGGGGPAGGGQSAIQIEMQNFTQVDAAIIEERNAEALSIAKDSAALARTVQDLNTLVVDQGVMLDVVEENVDRAAVKTEAAVQELTTAATYQGKYRCKCAMFWILAAIAAALITIPLVIHYGPAAQNNKQQ